MENSSRGYRLLSVCGQAKSFGVSCSLVGLNIGVGVMEFVTHSPEVGVFNFGVAIFCGVIAHREYARIVEAAS